MCIYVYMYMCVYIYIYIYIYIYAPRAEPAPSMHAVDYCYLVRNDHNTNSNSIIATIELIA